MKYSSLTWKFLQLLNGYSKCSSSNPLSFSIVYLCEKWILVDLQFLFSFLFTYCLISDYLALYLLTRLLTSCLRKNDFSHLKTFFFNFFFKSFSSNFLIHWLSFIIEFGWNLFSWFLLLSLSWNFCYVLTFKIMSDFLTFLIFIFTFFLILIALHVAWVLV